MKKILGLLLVLAATPALGQNAGWPPPGGAVAALGVYNSVAPTITNGQVNFLQTDANGNLNVNVKAGSGSGCAGTTGTPCFVNVQNWGAGGSALGAMANYGTSPGAVLVPGVNAFVTNTNANGQAASASSSPVVIASDQSAVPVNTQPATSGGLSNYFVQPTASDNHAVIKAGAGQVFKISITNNSATVNYVRLYNATTGFNGCNSATNLIYANAIPANTAVGGIADSWNQGLAFATGISICVTSGYATNDTTNATATAMDVNIGYK